MVTLFICVPAKDANNFPTAVEPVKVTFLTIGCAIKYSEISAGIPYTKFIEPFGMPASSKAFINSATLAGVSSGPLTIAVQPAAKAAATFLTTWLRGKFQGV